MSPGPDGAPNLRSLARLYDLQPAYTDVTGHRRSTSRTTLLAALDALGAPLSGMDDLASAWRARRQELWRRIFDPVTVAWEGEPASIRLRLPERRTARPPRFALDLEDGGEVRIRPEPAGPAPRSEDVEGVRYVQASYRLPGTLPRGYHRLRFEEDGGGAESLVIAAPVRAPARPPDRRWGVFLPLYALRSERCWGMGDLTDLERLTEWVCGLGGTVVATLPLLATFLDRPFEPSPYAPASRLFWNELFLDVDRVPELERSGEARRMVASPRFRRHLAALRRAALVDYRGTMEAKRAVLELLARTFFEGGGSSRGDFRSFVRGNPRVRDYAAFRAAGERRGATWWSWPDRERGGTLPPEGGNRPAYRYHLYVQWLLSGQIDEASRLARRCGQGLYFDFPLGVHPDGYDPWRERRSFCLRASAGSPPDPFFTGGQNWGFPPLHPEGVRGDGYRYPIACLRHLLRHAGVLRIDHVMGLHRLWWVPARLDPAQGVYVRYRPEEWYAILALESRRSGALVVGEDLGTVPSQVRRAMARHGVHRSYVLQYSVSPDRRMPAPTPPEESLASVNTHDMPTFAAFWRGDDIRIRVDRGWLGAEEAERERRARGRVRSALVAFLRREGMLAGDPARVPTTQEVLHAALAWLAASPAGMVVVNLEDLWQEDRPQNVPGTTDQYPNWRRPARHSLESFSAMPEVIGQLRMVDDRRRGRTTATVTTGASEAGKLGGGSPGSGRYA